MYVIIQNGSHQYRAWPGQFIKIEQVKLKLGEEWKSKQVLVFRNEDDSFIVGSPYIKKAEIRGRVIRHGKSKKVLVFKKNRRKGYRKTQGHRQAFTEIYIESFLTPQGKNIKSLIRKDSLKKDFKLEGSATNKRKEILQEK